MRTRLGGENVDSKTVEGFGEEWTKFDHSHIPEEILESIFDDYFRIFPWEALPDNPAGADVGCGTGRWALLVAPRVGSLLCIDASESALSVARKNLASFSNVTYSKSSASELPVGDGTLDFAYSLGVLHHVPDTFDAIESVSKKLKPGAPFLLYLYYAFDNRSLTFWALWKLSDMARRIISLSPFFIRYWLSQLIAILVYFPLAKIAKLLASIGLNVDSFPLGYYRDKAFYVMRTDALDRFGTRLEKRFSRPEITEMLINAGFRDIRFSDSQPYWCAVGIKHAVER